MDFLLHVEHATLGHIGYLDEILGEYRKISHSMTDLNNPSFHLTVEATLDAFQRARELGVPREVVGRGLSKFMAGLSLLYLEKGDLRLFRKYLNESHVVSGRFLGVQHRLLYSLRNMPSIAFAAYRLRHVWRALTTSARGQATRLARQEMP